MLAILLLIFFLGTPIALTIYNFLILFKNTENKRRRNFLWLTTIVLGVFFSKVLLEMGDVLFDAMWNKQIYSNQTHQPIWTGALLTVFMIFLLGIIGAGILIANDVNYLPPLVTVLCISSMYLNIAVQIVWIIQCSSQDGLTLAVLSLVPLNTFLIVITIIREKVKEWQENEIHFNEKLGKNRFIKKLNLFLYDAYRWPVVAMVMVLPLLGIVIMILTLFGQQPDSIIKAWTETTEWRLSLKEAPQSLEYDGHYLCTVAAGGHRKLVKPIRKGVRHGHLIVVNRQLLIANAFENVLEEKTPRFHRVVRNFYDKYGFPLADWIRNNKIACDITYFVMKPLEWIFLVILYLTDANPENRIAMQYITKPKKG